MLLKSTEGFIISDSFRSAWEIFKKEWIVVYAVQLLPIVVAIVYNMLISETNENSAFAMIWGLAYLVIQFIVSMGVIKAYVELIRGKKVTMDMITSVAPKAINFIVAQILMMLIIFGGFLLFIIPGIIFSIKFMFTPYLIVDKGMGPIEALKASAKMTDGVKWDIFGFMAATVVLMYSGILALFVGLIVTIPIGTLAYVILYDRLLKRL
ncbi:MAG: hypothetical protein BroJett025_09290 [Patescibacteria group bacterium]|nr:MAG: hypothetical protein BroJett025_09290 [Patescibacteria group bacterium]